MNVPLAPGGGGGDLVVLRFLHTNDLHGTIAPVKASLPAGPGNPSGSDLPPGRADGVSLGHGAERGGSAYLATIVRQVRAQDPQHTMLVDAGDAVHGTAATDLDRGRAMAEVMSAVGYDAATIGNHDFQWGVPALEERLKEEAFPTVVANVVQDDGSPLPGTRPYLVKDMGGVKVGVLGIDTTETPTTQKADHTKGVRFLDEEKAIQRYLPQMEAHGSELPVLLTHEGLAMDEMVAAHLSPGHLIIGGHSHDRTPDAIEVNGNFIVQAGFRGREVGLLEVLYDRRAHRILGVRHKLIPVDPSTVPADPMVARIVDKYLKRADEQLDQVVLTLPRPLDRSSRADSTFGNLVTDAIRTSAGTDVALFHSRGLRHSLPAGDVTFKTLYDAIPFCGEIHTGSISGQDLRAALEHSVSLRNPDPHGQTGFLQLSGLRMAYDVSRPEGQRVLRVEVGGRPLDPKRSYSIAIEDYLNGGAMGYAMLKGRAPHDTDATIMDAVTKYLRGGPWASQPPGPVRIEDRTPVG